MDAKGVFLFFHCALVGVPKSFASFSLFLRELWIFGRVFLEDCFGKATMKDCLIRAVAVGRKREKTLQLLGTLSRVIPGKTPLQKRNPRPKVVDSGGFSKLDAKGVFSFSTAPW
ncbi:hypothetical protein [Brevibacillus sp. SIMBA_040]|uniref:hypothetical protein n=1 Tax=unclassified Brevibacillus TaxID=2684853 RepID=UPI003979727A